MANLSLLANSDYIQIRQPVYTSHSAGRYAAKRFRKAQCPIIERLTNSIMMNGRNNGKKAMAVRIVAHAFEIVRFPSLCLQIALENMSTSEWPDNCSSFALILSGLAFLLI
jgi:hypothetical protein